MNNSYRVGIRTDSGVGRRNYGVPHTMFMSAHSDDFQWHPLPLQSQQMEIALSSKDATNPISF